MQFSARPILPIVETGFACCSCSPFLFLFLFIFFLPFRSLLIPLVTEFMDQGHRSWEIPPLPFFAFLCLSPSLSCSDEILGIREWSGATGYD